MEKLYEIQIDAEAIFLKRLNRYLAEVELESGETELVHVHDPGRLKELLYPGNRIKLKKAKNTERKTKWDVISADADSEDVLVNSMYHRYISQEILKKPNLNPLGELDSIKAEVKYGNSRIDYLVEKSGKKIWIEVKGVSLSENGVAMFPDAPTTRGQRHLKELMEIRNKGDRAAVYFLILRTSKTFRPRGETDPKFAELFYEAMDSGVEVYPILLEYKGGVVYYRHLLEVEKRSV